MWTLEDKKNYPLTSEGYKEASEYYARLNSCFAFLRDDAYVTQDGNTITVTTNPEEDNIIYNIMVNGNANFCHWFWVLPYRNKSIFKDIDGAYLNVDKGIYQCQINIPFQSEALRLKRRD